LAHSFSQEQPEEKWAIFASTVAADIMLYSGLTGSKPVMGDNFIIELTVLNKLQADKVSEAKTELLQYLRNQLQNRLINIETRINADISTAKAYTPIDKFNKMAEKNPMLLTLKKTFDMDIDF
jgi:DNA polymerase-3 subunit gamma/tau